MAFVSLYAKRRNVRKEVPIALARTVSLDTCSCKTAGDLIFAFIFRGGKEAVKQKVGNTSSNAYLTERFYRPSLCWLVKLNISHREKFFWEYNLESLREHLLLKMACIT